MDFTDNELMNAVKNEMIRNDRFKEQVYNAIEKNRRNELKALVSKVAKKVFGEVIPKVIIEVVDIFLSYS
ncbi:MAG: hypothetical protein F6K42_12225 [Leptolyngbya sp. SIO1D8]|nr:hypothetical protein [Leptolyngbya sp. SIO1D8]